MVKTAKMIKRHWSGILQWKLSSINNGILEGLNSGLCEFNRKRLRTSNMIERLNQSVKQRTKSSKLLSVNSHLSYQIHPYQSILWLGWVLRGD
jgi:transposase-like protein